MDSSFGILDAFAFVVFGVLKQEDCINLIVRLVEGQKPKGILSQDAA